MPEKFQVEGLPEVDQSCIKRGLCPWCMVPLFDNGKSDECPECADIFVGKITIED